MIDVGLVLPGFALLALGVLLRRWWWRYPPFWVDLERLVYSVLFPVLLVRTTLAADLAAAGTGAVLLAGLGATAAGAVLGAVAWWLPAVERSTAASGWRTAFRFNSLLALADGESARTSRRHHRLAGRRCSAARAPRWGCAHDHPRAGHPAALAHRRPLTGARCRAGQRPGRRRGAQL